MAEATRTVYSPAITSDDMGLTPAAESKLAELFADADPDIEAIRLFVTGGGCGGMAYGMTYAEAITEYDSALAGSGYKLVVDAVALNFLAGCEIDFSEDGFRFRNVFQAVGGSGTCGGCAGGGY